ncbi:MAG: ATP-binding protein [bacterium]|nr:ATP-binding protein [bacterium]
MHLWRYLILPLRPSDAPAAKANLLSLILLPMIVTVLGGVLWDLTPLGSTVFGLYLILSSVILTIAYGLNRLGRYQMAASVTILVLMSIPFASLVTDRVYDPVQVMIVLVTTLPAVLAAYLLFAVRGTAAAVLLAILSMLLLPMLRPQIPFSLVLFPLYIMVAVGLLVLIAALIRRESERELEINQRELAESEARFRNLFAATLEPLAVVSDDTVFDANPALAALLELPLAQVIGRKITSLIHPEDVQRVLHNTQSGQMEPQEVRLIGSDGGVIPVELRGKKHQYKGEMLRVIAVRDVRGTKQAETRRVELAVEREKVNVLQRFIGNMSHDLRTPLTVIKTSIYLMNRLKNDPDAQQQQMETLTLQVDNLQRLFDDLLSMSKLDKADTSDYRFKWMNINPPTREAVEDEQRLALRRRQMLAFIPGDALPNLLIDQYEFKRMIKHLILNGLGYTPEGGTVTVSTFVQGRELVIAVGDSGIGISPLELPFIFERFYRRDSLQDSDDGGTGLGLNIARKIAEAHGGSITVESEVGKGSIFRVCLPILDEAQAMILLNEQTKGSA